MSRVIFHIVTFVITRVNVIDNKVLRIIFILMDLSSSAYPPERLASGPNAHLIGSMTIVDNQLTEHWYRHPDGSLANQGICTRKRDPILVNPKDCE